MHERTPEEQSPQEEILKQNLDEKADINGLYMIQLLFREKVSMLESSMLLTKLQERFGEIDVVSGGEGLVSFAVRKFPVTYRDNKTVPAQVILIECNPVTKPIGDAVARTQFWDCQNGVELLDSCPWAMMVSDFLSRGLPPLERAELISGWLDIVLELAPQCVVVYFGSSGKLLTADDAKANPYEGALRFIHRCINIQNESYVRA